MYSSMRVILPCLHTRRAVELYRALLTDRVLFGSYKVAEPMCSRAGSSGKRVSDVRDCRRVVQQVMAPSGASVHYLDHKAATDQPRCADDERAHRLRSRSGGRAV
jgi:hypothetical protein